MQISLGRMMRKESGGREKFLCSHQRQAIASCTLAMNGREQQEISLLSLLIYKTSHEKWANKQ